MTRTTQQTCPQCGDPLPLGISATTPVPTLCVTCGVLFRLNAFIDTQQGCELPATLPPRTSILKTAQGVKITYRHPKSSGIITLIFSLLWNSLLAFGLIVAIADASHGGPWANKLAWVIPIPFILVGLASIPFAIYLLWGRMALTLTPGRGKYFHGTGPFGRTRRFLITKNADITLSRVTRRRTLSVLFNISVGQPGGGPFLFGSRITPDTTQFLIITLLRSMRA